MAKEAAGLSFSNPFMEKTNVGEIPNPYAPYSPTSSIGLGGLGPSAADMAMTGEALVKQSQFTMPEMKRPAAIAFSPSENKLFVNGLTFGADDAATALQSESYLRGPGTQLPTGGDWVPLDEQAYGQYLSGIRNPGLGRLASKNFGRGVDVMQLLAGRGLQLAGAEETGGAIVESQMEDLRKTSPYERMATDVKSGSDAIDWFVANFAQQGPNLIESVLTAGAGFLAGTAAGGPLAGAGAALAGLMGKEAFKQSVIAAAKKKVAGEVLNAAEGKLLREAAGIAGAVATSYGQNFATGAADIYGELREQGADATDTDARLKALAGAVPYAALESLPEFLLATRLFGGVVSPRAIPAGASRLQRGVSYAGRAATGGAVGGTAEGLTETGQEGLLLGISGQDLSSPEAVDRLINSFAAGFGVGGPLGAVANLKGKAPANLLKPAENPDPTSTSLTVPPPTTPGTAVSPYYTPVTPMGPIAPPPAQLAGPPTVPQLPPPGQVLQVQGRPDFVVDSNGTVRQAMPEDVVVGVSGNIPGQQVNQQGVLDIFGGQPVTAGELAARMTPQGVPPLGYTPQAPQPSPQQGALQFAPPAPLPTSPVNPQMQNQLQIIQDQLRRQNEFAAAQQQREEQQAAEQDLIAQQSKNARDLYILQQQQQRQPPTTAMPMVPIQPRMPQQLSLFSRREAPVPSRAEGLRRGVGTQLPEPSVGTLPRKDLRRSTQVPMFTQQGQPSMPALKAAGVTSKLPAPKIEAGATQIPPTGKPVNAVTVAKAKAATAKKETETKAKLKKGVEKLKAKEKADAVQKRGAEALLTRKRAEAGKRVGAEIPSKREVAGKGEALKTKAKSKDDEQRQAIQDALTNAAVKRGELIQAKRQWPQYADTKTQPKWEDLSPAQQEQWRKLVVEEQKPTIDATRQIAPVVTKTTVPPKKGLPSPKEIQDGAKVIRDMDEDVRDNTMPSDMEGGYYAYNLFEAQNLLPKPSNKLKKITDNNSFNLVNEVEYIANVDGEHFGVVKDEDPDDEDATVYRYFRLDQPFTQYEPLTDDVQELFEDMRKHLEPTTVKETPLKKPVAAPAVVAPVEEKFKPKTVAELEAEAAAARPAGAAIAEVEQTPTEILTEEIQIAETTTDIRTFKDAIQTVVFHAFFDTDSNNVKAGLIDRAQAFLNNTQFTESQRQSINQALLDVASGYMQLEATYTRGKNKDQEKAWFTYAVQRNLLPSIRAKLINLPAQYKTSVGPVSGKIATTKPIEGTAKRIFNTPEAILGELISDLITQIRNAYGLDKPFKSNGQTFDNIVALAKDLYAQTTAAGKNYIVRGFPLKEYFKADGTPKTMKSGDRFLITNKEMTAAQQRQIEKEQKEALKALAAEDKALREAEFERQQIEKQGFKEEDDWDSDTGMFYRDDGSPLTATIPAGRVSLLVRSFLSKLKIKPTVNIFRNVNDLKTRNPALYKRAAAARKEGDFDTTNAGGYSFGPNVIIFTDFIRTEQQLKFILAHETLGHFGMRGVVPKADLDRVLNSIYNSDSDVQAAVDAMVNNQGMSKLEAIEEYLADNAADLDVSIISRLWNVLKNFLNKLGFEFQDDEARYFVNQARKYVRRGDTGNFISAKSIALDVAGLDQAVEDGRYARMGFGEMASNAFAAGGLNYNTGFGATRGLRGAVEAFAKNAFGKRKDVPGTVASLLEQIQTLDNKARRSFGLSEIYRMLESQQQYARALLSKYQRMTSFTHSVDLGIFKKGVTEGEKEETGKLLAHAALLKARGATDEFIKSFDSMIYQDAAGSLHIDHWVREEIEKVGRVTAEEFRKGFDIDYDDGMGNVTKQRFQMDVDENSDTWKVYLEQREAVNEAAIDMMLANYEAAQAEGDRIIGDVNKGRSAGNKFTAEDLQAIRKAAELYQNARYASSDVANAGVELKNKSIQNSEDFLVAFGRALFNTNAFNDWMNKTGTAAAFAGAEYDDLRAALPSLRAKIRSDKDSFAAQKAIRDLFFFDLQSKNAEYYAKHTILGSYVPFTRRGDQQVRIVAVDDKGNPVKLDENVRNVLPYFQFNSRSEADAAAADLELQFGDDDYTLLDENGNEVSVRFVAEISKVRQSPDLTETVNFNEFIYVLNRLNANIAPEVREKIITTLTSQNSRARKNLQRSGTPGWDKDVIRSVSEHLETTAHVAAKKLYRHRLDDVLLNDSNWLGDAAKLRALKDAVDNAQTDGQRARAQRAYDEYAFQYQYMAGSRPGGAKTVEIDGKQVPTLGRGEDYREDAKEVLRWYSEATNITDSTEDLLSGEVGSKLKLITVLMQLGGSVATAVINLASIATHSLPYLASYNPKRAFGGGYGFAKSSTALYEALNNVKNVKMADPAWLNNMVEVDKNWDDYGLTEDEAKFLFNQTEEGTLQAAQFNALIGTARGKVFDNRAQAAIKAWMSMFSYTEQMNRRATALAAYRLEKERALSQGIPEAQAIAEATEAARKAVNTSQGEYAMFNRPEMARGNVLQYVFVYKQFVLLTVQLLRNLPPKSQMLMLGFLLLAGGIKGLPFAEDIFDIVDTIAQKLGLKMASIEKEIAMWVDSVAPGMTPYVMRGVLDQMTGSTISSRMGMGDLIPLTGAFRAGADPAREVADFAGPVFSGIAGLVGTAGSLAKYGAEVIGLRDDTTSFNTILRESPVAAMRAVGDSLAYTQSGMITNVRGQVVAKEAGAHTIIARLLGFYPAIATQQNDIVRLSKYVSEYNKAIKADYVGAYVKAKMAGDTDRMQELSATVREWNEDAKGTGLEVKNFEKSANRAALEAGRPTALRYLKSAPKQMRPETIELLKAHGIYDEIN